MSDEQNKGASCHCVTPPTLEMITHTPSLSLSNLSRILHITFTVQGITTAETKDDTDPSLTHGTPMSTVMTALQIVPHSWAAAGAAKVAAPPTRKEHCARTSSERCHSTCKRRERLAP